VTEIVYTTNIVIRPADPMSVQAIEIRSNYCYGYIMTTFNSDNTVPGLLWRHWLNMPLH